MILVSTWRFGLEANAAAWPILESGGAALDAVVTGVEVAERDPSVRSVGLGGHPNAAGVVQVDGAVMDGRNLGYGAVCGLERIATPTAVARRVMEKTKHVMLVGPDALAFARAQGFVEEDLLVDETRAQWETWKAGQSGVPTDAHDTIGMLALDSHGDIAAACTTSGVAYKLPGRVGDSPLIGCGLYADNDIGAAAATGQGEEIARTCGSFAIVQHMREGCSPQEACERVVRHLIDRVPTSRPFQMAYIAINRHGDYGAAAARPSFPYAVASATENALRDGRTFLTD